MPDARRRAYLQAMGIDLWRVRTEAEAPAPALSDAAAPHRGPDNANTPAPLSPDSGRRLPSGAALDPGPAALSWDALRSAVGVCTACGLHETRTQTVFGVGDQNARLVVIGEAPGADEDRAGEPFVGRAGQLLNAMLAAIGLAREQVYIANIVKCRPPGNRDPHADEAAACQPYLHRQIALLAPDVILAVGRVSAHNLLGTEEAVGRLRGRAHRFDPGDIPLIVTYHPAYLLRRPHDKAKAWQDLQAVYRLLHAEPPETG
jgi:uracil-DNA glycosylase family 4